MRSTSLPIMLMARMVSYGSYDPHSSKDINSSSRFIQVRFYIKGVWDTKESMAVYPGELLFLGVFVVV